MAPPAGLVRGHLDNLLYWLHDSEEPPLIASSVFHYEFEFINPFSDGNGRMGRFWQTLILSNWKPLLAYLPIIRNRQAEYYASLGQVAAQGSATAFLEFMLRALCDTLGETVLTDQVNVQVADQVHRLLAVLAQGEQSAAVLLAELGLRHIPSFRKNYLDPAIDAGLVELTQPDSPRSPTQRYRLTAKGRGNV